jgi:hypothetical protein
MVLRHFLEPGEWVEANEGYRRGQNGQNQMPGNLRKLAEKRAMQDRVRVRHKMLNGWLKNWEILS